MQIYSCGYLMNEVARFKKKKERSKRYQAKFELEF